MSTLPQAQPTAARAPLLRLALIGQPLGVNVWSLYDESGSSYADLALHSSQYPSLYRLSQPAHLFEPGIADGLPTALQQEGPFFVATVKLQKGLYWSDGSPLTSRDVVFTATTALSFRLGLDWAAYDVEFLDHIEVPDESTVKFFFKQSPDVAAWQYGILQGPVVSQAYWSPKISAAQALLPSPELAASLDDLKSSAGSLQLQIDNDNNLLGGTTPGTQSYSDLVARITRNQNDLNPLTVRMAKLQDEYDAALVQAQSALFALPAPDEPAFGPFLPAVKTGAHYTRKLNPSYPFGRPNFDSVSYSFYADTSSALAALQAGSADLLLNPQATDLAISPAVQDQSLRISSFPTSSARFLAVQPANKILADPVLRRAIFCALDRTALAGSLDALPLDSFVLSGAGDWKNVTAVTSCADENGNPGAVNILKAHGYRWLVEPTAEHPGEGLVLPDGTPFPVLRLLALDQQSDPQRAQAAHLIELSLARVLALPLTVQYMSAEDLRYAVYSTGSYDLALLGWRLSEYPSYLCSWFSAPSPFAFQDERLASACSFLRSSADLGTARQAAYDAQAVLAQDLPLIPVYQGLGYEVQRSISFPFGAVLNGISSIYGAPELALPAP